MSTLSVQRNTVHADTLRTTGANAQHFRSPRRRPQLKADRISTQDVDYFSLKPRSRTRSDTKSGYNGVESAKATTPGGAISLPLKSPQHTLLATSYGTQASSQGSSGRGSSWALSAFFRSASSVSLANRRDGTDHTPPLTTTHSEHTSPSSPGVPRRSPPANAAEKARPLNAKSLAQTTRTRQSTHVSFATEVTTPQDVLDVTQQRRAAKKRQAKVVIRTHADRETLSQDSVLNTPMFCAQSTATRLCLANLLDRMQMPLLRTEVVKLNTGKKAASSSGLTEMAIESGLHVAAGRQCPLALHLACQTCGSLPKGSAPPYCTSCRSHCKPVLCSICQLPLSGESCILRAKVCSDAMLYRPR